MKKFCYEDKYFVSGADIGINGASFRPSNQRRCDMSIMTMDMSSYEVDADCAKDVEYSEEILNSGWNPVLAVQHHLVTELNVISSNLVIEDIPAFLRKMYASQR